jgi:outer membrane protein assembly factor BamD (BamD/ComL family)
MKDLPSVPVATASAVGPRVDDLAAERAALDVARTALGRGDGANALAACDDHSRKYPRGALAEEREAIAVQALVLEHRGDDARARAERFRKTHPRSILLPAVLAAAGIDP